MSSFRRHLPHHSPMQYMPHRHELQIGAKNQPCRSLGSYSCAAACTNACKGGTLLTVRLCLRRGFGLPTDCAEFGKQPKCMNADA